MVVLCVMLEARVGTEIIGDVAVNDITFSSKCKTTECEPGEFECAHRACIPLEQVCNFRDDCGDDSDEWDCPAVCTFERDACGWEETDGDDYNWIRAKANDPGSGTNGTGPDTDQSQNPNGHFLLLHETLDMPAGQVAHTFSPTFQDSKALCTFTFWYYMDQDLGSDILLELNINSTGANSSAYSVILGFFSEEMATGTIWVYGSTGIGRHKDPFQLSLYATKNEGYGGVFALDEVRFEECDYPTASTEECLPSYYHCSFTKVGS